MDLRKTRFRTLMAVGVYGIVTVLMASATADESTVTSDQPLPPIVDMHNSRNALGQAEASDLPTPGDLQAWGPSQYLFAAKLVGVERGPTARSMPPIYTLTLRLEVERSMRGKLTAGDSVTVSFQARQLEEPVLPLGVSFVIGAAEQGGRLRADRIERADDETLVAAHRVGNLLPGWSVKEGKLSGPWASLADKAWPDKDRLGDQICRCGMTGRPVLTVGRGAALSVEAVPPAEAIQWTNPDGDGEYRIRLKNTTDRPISIAALRRVDGRLLWTESLIAIHNGKSMMLPGAGGLTEAGEAAELKPGEEVSTVVNILALQGIDWPRGGSRVEIMFAMGEKVEAISFYYMSRHHDALPDFRTSPEIARKSLFYKGGTRDLGVPRVKSGGVCPSKAQCIRLDQRSGCR